MSDNLKKFDRYLGDGLYASFDGYQVELQDAEQKNQVYLDSHVQQALTQYLCWLNVELQKEEDEKGIVK